MPENAPADTVTYLNLISFGGLIAMVLMAWLMSSHRGKVNWRLVVTGLGFQLLLGLIFFNSQQWTFSREFSSFDTLYAACQSKQVELANVPLFPDETDDTGNFASDFEELNKTELREKYWRLEAGEVLQVPRFQNGVVFYVLDAFFGLIKQWSDVGAEFVFGANGPPEDFATTDKLFLLKTFAFGVLPTVIFFAALMSVLYHIGIMEPIVRAMAWVMQKVLGTSGSESLAAAANVFVGHTEAPLVVRPYIEGMTRSELNAMMVGGFATITGGLMAIFVNIGVSAGHLVTASIISAPAALVVAKILQPETEQSDTMGTVSVSFEKQSANVIEAAATGASDGMKLAINIAAMLIAFLALIAMLDAILFGIGELVQYLLYGSDEAAAGFVDLNWTLNGLFGYIFWPFAWLMGIETKDCMASGQLLGTKMVVNEFVAYIDLSIILGDMNANGGAAKTIISERTEIILTYALCGFSNFGAIGIQLGGIGPLAPSRKSDLAQLGLRAMLGGMLACCMTACVAGMLYGLTEMLFGS